MTEATALPQGADVKTRRSAPIFLALFAVYTVVAIVMLLIGLVPALAKAVPAIQETLEGWAQGSDAVASFWLGMAQASQYSESLGRVTLDYLFSVLNVGFGIFIVWRRPWDWTARILGLALVGTGNVFNFQAHTSLLTLWAPLSGLHLGYHAVSGATYVHALLIFPNGKLAPRWSVWGIALTYLLMVLAIAFAAVPAGAGEPLDVGEASELYGSIFSLEAIFFVLFFGVLIPIIGVTSLVYRYRAVYTATERQQTKYVVWGIGVSFTAAVVILFATTGLYVSQGTGFEELLERLEDSVFANFPLLFAIVPLALVISVLRRRLFDIDVLINRTLVYAVLTATLVGTYFGIVVALQAAIRAATDQGSAVAVVVSTLAIAALVQPLRRRIQDFIDRRFFRRKYDAALTLAAFSDRIRDEVDLEKLREELVGLVQETMEPAHISLWLRQAGRRRRENSNSD